MIRNIKKFFLQLFWSRNNPLSTYSSYRPVRNLDGKKNFKRYFRIGRDGRTVERILLELPTKKQREEIIFKHFLKFLEGDLKQRVAQYEIISRDDPWDFTVQSSFDEKFHVEITSVSESDWAFEKSMREEEYRKLILHEKIPFRKLKKLALWFGTKDLQDAVDNFLGKDLSGEDIVINPLFKKPGVIFLSDTKEEVENLYKIVYAAIEKKVRKPHNEKEKTILIVDNRTIKFGINDYFEMMNIFSRNKIIYPFKEIFFYTGYYSDEDGNNSEFSFSEIQLSGGMRSLLRECIESHDIKLNNDGVYYC